MYGYSDFPTELSTLPLQVAKLLLLSNRLPRPLLAPPVYVVIQASCTLYVSDVHFYYSNKRVLLKVKAHQLLLHQVLSRLEPLGMVSRRVKCEWIGAYLYQLYLAGRSLLLGELIYVFGSHEMVIELDT
jgi:hypothetical protein